LPIIGRFARDTLRWFCDECKAYAVRVPDKIAASEIENHVELEIVSAAKTKCD
jgi:hypothetical protein